MRLLNQMCLAFLFFGQVNSSGSQQATIITDHMSTESNAVLASTQSVGGPASMISDGSGGLQSPTNKGQPLFPDWKYVSKESPDIDLVVPSNAIKVPMRSASIAQQKVGERYVPQGMKLTHAFMVDLNGDGNEELLVFASNRHNPDLSQAEYRSPGLVLLDPGSTRPRIVRIGGGGEESPDIWESIPVAYRYEGRNCIASAWYFRAEPGIVVACSDSKWHWLIARRYPLTPGSATPDKTVDRVRYGQRASQSQLGKPAVSTTSSSQSDQLRVPDIAISLWNETTGKLRRTTPAIDSERFIALARAWLMKISAGDLNSLASLSPAPFYFREAISATENDVRASYAKFLADVPRGQKVAAGYVGHINVADLRASPQITLHQGAAHLLQDQDLVVDMMILYGEYSGPCTYYVRPGQELRLLGLFLNGPRPARAKALRPVRDPTELSGTPDMVLTVSVQTGWRLGSEKITSENLGARLQAIYRLRANKVLGLRVPMQIPYRQLIEIIDTAVYAGVGDIYVAKDDYFIPARLILTVPPQRDTAGVMNDLPKARNIGSPSFRDPVDPWGIVIKSATSFFFQGNALSREDAAVAALRLYKNPFWFGAPEPGTWEVCLSADAGLAVGTIIDVIDACQKCGVGRIYLNATNY